MLTATDILEGHFWPSRRRLSPPVHVHHQKFYFAKQASFKITPSLRFFSLRTPTRISDSVSFHYKTQVVFMCCCLFFLHFVSARPLAMADRGVSALLYGGPYCPAFLPLLVGGRGVLCQAIDGVVDVRAR